MASNIDRTAVTFWSPVGNVSGIVKRAIHGHRTGAQARAINSRQRPGGLRLPPGSNDRRPVRRAYAAFVARAHFRIFGVPVRVEPFFVIVAALFGIGIEPLWVVFVFVVVVFVSVLVHELGHALTYRALGQRSAIVLHGFGGFTVPAGGGRRVLSKGKSVLVSVSGALTQLLVLGIPARIALESDWASTGRSTASTASAGGRSSTGCSSSASGGRCSTCCRSGRSTAATSPRPCSASRTPAACRSRPPSWPGSSPSGRPPSA
jgi:hypothetical protein